MVDESTASEAGELLGARFLLSGGLVFTAGSVTFSARISDTESGEITAAVSRTGEIEALFTLQEEITEELISRWDIPLSRKEWGLSGRKRQCNSERYYQPGKRP